MKGVTHGKIKSGMFIAISCIVLQLGMCINAFAEENVLGASVSENSTEVDKGLSTNELLPDERIIPTYNASYTDTFMAGSDEITIIIWIDANQGGVTLTANGDCDFVVEGTVYDSWGDAHDFSGRRDQTGSCQIYGGCYSTYQQIERIYVKCIASSYDGTGYYEKDIWLSEMG